jgi:predicted MFS family arabinose efflux permease
MKAMPLQRIGVSKKLNLVGRTADQKRAVMDTQNYAVAGIGLVLGAALGTVLFALLGQVWVIGAGAGLIVGAVIDAAWARQRATKHEPATKPDPDDRLN